MDQQAGIWIARTNSNASSAPLERVVAFIEPKLALISRGAVTSNTAFGKDWTDVLLETYRRRMLQIVFIGSDKFRNRPRKSQN